MAVEMSKNDLIRQLQLERSWKEVGIFPSPLHAL